MNVLNLIRLANEFALMSQASDTTLVNVKKEELPQEHSKEQDISMPQQPKEAPGLGLDFAQVAHTVRNFVADKLGMFCEYIYPVKQVGVVGYAFQITPSSKENKELFNHIKHLVKKLYPSSFVRESNNYLEMEFPEDDAKIVVVQWKDPETISFKIDSLNWE